MNLGKDTFLGIITARGGSKGIPKKNLKPLAGKPLIEYTFDAVKNSKLLNRCIVSSDDKEIIDFSKKQNVEVLFKRPDYLATDAAKTVDVIEHALLFLQSEESYSPEYVITLQPTSPLRTSEDIDNSIKLIKSDPSADSLVSVTQIPHNFSPYSAMIFDGKYLYDYIKGEKVYQRDKKPRYYARNGAAIYISTSGLILEQKRIIGDKILPYFMPRERSVDIDDLFDWDLAEFLIKKTYSIERKL